MHRQCPSFLVVLTVLLAAAGGDLTLQNIPGYGVDVYLTLERLDGNVWKEQVDDGAVSAAAAMQKDLHQRVAGAIQSSNISVP